MERTAKKIFSLTGKQLEDLSSDDWAVAELDAGGGQSYVDTTYRKSGRIMVDDNTTVAWILEKLNPYLDEIRVLRPDGRLSDSKTSRSDTGEVVKLVRLNERLRFLRYGPGSYFKVADQFNSRRV